MSRILVFGKTGQVATELARITSDAYFAGRDKADLSVPETCDKLIRQVCPSAVINAAAYTAVDEAESNPATAQVINADAPGAMAQTCADLGIPFVHISTDYVFDGTGTDPRKEDSPTRPLNVYGRTKLAGEQAVIARNGQYTILRTSWVFSAHGNNFVKTMRHLGRERTQLAVVADQVGGPTAASDIARAVLLIATAMMHSKEKHGVYHFASKPDTSWADFAREIFAQSDLSPVVTDILTRDYSTPAQRPLNSRLNCNAIARDFGINQPDWQISLTEVIKELSYDTA